MIFAVWVSLLLFSPTQWYLIYFCFNQKEESERLSRGLVEGSDRFTSPNPQWTLNEPSTNPQPTPSIQKRNNGEKKLLNLQSDEAADKTKRHKMEKKNWISPVHWKCRLAIIKTLWNNCVSCFNLYIPEPRTNRAHTGVKRRILHERWKDIEIIALKSMRN